MDRNIVLKNDTSSDDYEINFDFYEESQDTNDLHVTIMWIKDNSTTGMLNVRTIKFKFASIINARN